MLAADAAMKLVIDRSAELEGHLHELANALLIELCERIILKDLGVIVSVEELACVVTAEAEGHLSKIVGAEAEEVSLCGDLISGKAGSGDLDHGADFVADVAACGCDLGVSRAFLHSQD